ncbi:MAG TPA: diguanylate cyclase, partial [Desulfobacterales bacterium]|nr:diguanylate cyclase [Desulfobacterales bacterium]
SGFRYGGDEFAVILIDADETIALEIASRIKNAIKKECSVDISFGVASFSEEASDVERLLKKADKELYLSRGIELKALKGDGGA